MIDREEYRDYCGRMRSVERYLRSKSADPDLVAYNICKLRDYPTTMMMDILKKAGFMFIEGKESVYDHLHDSGDDLGLFSKDGKFLLSGRFIFPVRDMLGNTIAFIGWFNDEKKYITTPSKLFSKSCMFFGMEQLITTGVGERYWIVEGIFDTLALRAIGKHALGEMGSVSGRVKEAMYPLFKMLCAAPDNDETGRKVIENNAWNLPSNGKYLKIVGNSVKDIDDMINNYEREDVLDLLSEVESSNDRVFTQRL